MKKYILLLQLMFTAAVFAQNPVRWTTQAIQTDTLKFDVIITANIDENGIYMPLKCQKMALCQQNLFLMM